MALALGSDPSALSPPGKYDIRFRVDHPLLCLCHHGLHHGGGASSDAHFIGGAVRDSLNEPLYHFFTYRNIIVLSPLLRISFFARYP
jgi:hypothetical protein